MESLKMSDVFGLPVSVGEKAASRASAILDGRGTFGIINDQAMEHSRHAINNHDRLVEENAELREASGDFESVLSRVMLECSMSDELSEDVEKLLNQIGIE